MSKIVDYKEMWQMLMGAGKLALVSHIGPDGDTLSAALGLARVLRQKGKDVRLFVDDDVPGNMDFLPGIKDYEHPEEGKTLAFDLVVSIDISSADRMGLCEKVLTGTLVNIDHHISNTKYAESLLLDAEASATGEIIYDILKANDVEFDYETALCLYTAIVTDCGYFKYANTTVKAMRAGADLLGYGIHAAEISDRLEMKSRETMELLRKVLPTLTFYEDGKVASMEISHELYNKDIPTDSFIYYPRYVEGVDAAVMFKEVEPAVTRVSMRSKNVDVSAVALSFGGGGHVRAAGCTVNAPLQAAKKRVVDALIQAVRNLK